jgi:hypothetical protein
MLCYHYRYVTVLPQCDAIVSKKSESVMAGGANDAETLCSWRSKLTLLTLSDAVTIDNCDAIFSFCHLEWEADKQGD